MRASVLEALGVNEDDLKSMSADEREAIEAKIKEMIKAKVEQAQDEHHTKGAFIDVRA